ncbi:cytochrome c oxidase subunit 3 [Achromobacter aloeverae]|uniref:Cytochrome C oxidase subunit III n=1 Tax=Achromobacter aloeverae TaxID=1750518 RepID=A0A4Q1HMT4_9BURK|nr:cytochrome c oxidase subunit 3 [Achromobacter aloeverae]RXN92294.1 cytochrome C oxidase subunit III [Achromobacter aloeverae]
MKAASIPPPGEPPGDAVALDVRTLPSFGFGHRSIIWWATIGLMLIESTVFALAVLTYFYLRGLAAQWPTSAEPPDLTWGTVNTLVLLASLWPAHLAKAAAERCDRRAAARWMDACMAFTLAFLAIRWLEFMHLNISWSSNAYGSILWFLLGLHTTHLVTDAIDSAVLTVLLHTGPFEGRRHVDVSENAVYWYFVVASWIPIYAVIYLAPRF